MANTRITEKLVCDYKQVECDDPIVLYWVNSIGGVDGWVFEGNRQLDDTDGDHATYEQAIGELETTELVVGTLRKSHIQKITVQASSLTNSQYNGILEVISSPKIIRLINPGSWQSEGIKTQDVIIATGTHSTETIGSLKTITLTIVLQPKITVSS